MSGETWGSEEYVSGQFKEFYAIGAQHIEAPSDIVQREFGFLSFGGRTMFRHIGFEDTSKLRSYIRNYAPAHTYFSAAYYEDPRAPMAEKGWLGADLVFDIDADHFDLPCQKIHDRWVCTTCGKQGTGHPPDRCPECQKASYVEETWLCEDCLGAAKYEVQKLLDILIEDFGFQPSTEISVNFSGNRGYHVHVRSPAAKGLDQLARREVVDYILGIGIKADHQSFTSRQVGGGPMLEQGGWRGRSIRALYDFIADASPKQVEALSLGRTASRNLIEKREEILDSLMSNHPSRTVRYIDKKSMDKLLGVAVKEQASEIDTVVTTDLRRLIRLPNTLHGKTGWLSQDVTIDDLADYNPLKEAIAFREGTEKLYIRRAPEIVIEGENYGPYEDETRELPLAVAMFLLCRKAARVVE
ncbi:MAG: DNA primase small subunit PriS [Candidatus Bathyarchaeota archaeon]|jgi:DNA primase small subunit